MPGGRRYYSKAWASRILVSTVVYAVTTPGSCIATEYAVTTPGSCIATSFTCFRPVGTATFGYEAARDPITPLNPDPKTRKPECETLPHSLRCNPLNVDPLSVNLLPLNRDYNRDPTITAFDRRWLLIMGLDYNTLLKESDLRRASSNPKP